MFELAKIHFYRISKCGFYQYGSDTPEFGGVQEMLAECKNWAFDDVKSIRETCTYDPAESGDILPTYFFAMSQSGNSDFILTTWNETETMDGDLGSVDGSDIAGLATVNLTEVEDGHIPGFPSYFWFVPELNAFATIRFGNQRSNGHVGMRHLLKEFLNKYSNHVAYAEPSSDDQIDVVGYREDASSPVEPLYAVFKTHQERAAGSTEYLYANAPRINKLIRKSTLQPEIGDDRSLYEKLLNNLGLANCPPLNNDINVKSEFPFAPTRAQLSQIISEWESNHDNWENVGFKLAGDDEVRWLSHTIVKTELSLDVDRLADGTISVTSIASAVSDKRAELIGLLV